MIKGKKQKFRSMSGSGSGSSFYRKYKKWLSNKNPELGKKIGWLLLEEKNKNIKCLFT